MGRNPGRDPPFAAFGALLDRHLRAGTRPDPNNSEPWTDTAFAKAIPGRDADSQGSSPRRVANWRKGTSLPNAIEPILRALFGPIRSDGGADREQLRDAYDRARLADNRATIEAAPLEPDAVDYIEAGARLVLVAGAASDAEAAADPAIARRLATVIERLHDLLEIVGARLDNQRAWRLLPRRAQRALDAADRPIADLPSHLIDLYDNTVSLGSFIAQDDALGSDPEAFDLPLDHDIRRAVVDYLAVAAPWLRGFPSVLAWDSARQDFLSRPELFEPVRASLDAARGFFGVAATARALSPEDAERGALPLETAARPGVLAEKAAYRGVANARRLLTRSTALMAGFLSGAVASDFATRSDLVKHLGALLADGEQHAQQLALVFADDLKAAVANVLVQNRKRREQGGGTEAALPATPGAGPAWPPRTPLAVWRDAVPGLARRRRRWRRW